MDNGQWTVDNERQLTMDKADILQPVDQWTMKGNGQLAMDKADILLLLN
ncbi:MAG: hypothetical protein LBB49_03575 [Gracilibacteraceae bacterium]|jgi:hypothetical protein|nr:hypothetical protein [Gracilibacteraceae bacterium]